MWKKDPLFLLYSFINVDIFTYLFIILIIQDENATDTCSLTEPVKVEPEHSIEVK